MRIIRIYLKSYILLYRSKLKYVMKFLAVLDYDFFGRDYLNVAEIVAPCAELIWFRIKNIPNDEILFHAEKLRKLLPHSKLILSQNPVIAQKACFDGVHLNSRCQKPEEVKKLFPHLIIGYSAHSVQECISVESHYKTLSPIFKVNKPYETKPLGLIKSPCENVYALGGITAENFSLIKNCGFYGIAGIRLCLEINNIRLK